MFTGIIEGQGTVRRWKPAGSGRRLTVEADFPLEGTRTGDSIAVNGACLTAVRVDAKGFDADLSPETLAVSALETSAGVGARVNLERALRLSDRLDGHLVSGHVDGIAILTERTREANALVLSFRVDRELSRYLIRKGSVAVDGVSLTVNRCDGTAFTVSVIPHTAAVTTLGGRRIGDPVNIETDMIGKYVERFLQQGGKWAAGGGGIDMDLLARTGFLRP
jgi:riboflavin synthase